MQDFHLSGAANPVAAPDRAGCRDPDLDGGEGRFLHLGLMVEDLDAAIAGARRHGAQSLPRGDNWLALPDGLVIELMQAGPDAVARIRAIDPRG